MSHQTKCPNCQTVYPLPASKVGIPDARAKCKVCQNVFFINQHLIEQTPPPPAEPKRPKKPKPTPSEDMIFDGMDGEEAPTPTQTSAEVSFSDHELDAFLNKDAHALASIPLVSTKDENTDTDSEAWVHDLLDESKPSVATQVQYKEEVSQPDADFADIIPVATPTAKKPIDARKFESDKPTTQQLATKTNVLGQIGWLVGCIVLVALLGVQYVIFNFDTLAKNPSHMGMINSICGVVGCQVPESNLKNLNISTSVRNNKDIIIVIQNTTEKEIYFPHLLVQLRDASGSLVGEFVATTDDYLSESQNSLLANQRKRIMLTPSEQRFVATASVKPFY